jgi:hypothetical protein
MEDRIKIIEERLEFYKDEAYDEDMQRQLSNNYMGTSVAKLLNPDIEEFDSLGYYDNFHWSYYIFRSLREKMPTLYARVINSLNADESSIKLKPLNMSQERTLYGIACKGIPQYKRTELGRQVAKITNELIAEREKQIEELKAELVVLRKESK